MNKQKKSPRSRTRAHVPITLLLDAEDHGYLARLIEHEKLSQSDVLRRLIRDGWRRAQLAQQSDPLRATG